MNTINNGVILARFGGGQGFSGGGGVSSGGISSSSNYGGGVSGGSSFLSTIFVIVIIGIYILFYFLKSRKNGNSMPNTSLNGNLTPINLPSPDLAPLQTLDPNFSPQRFMDHVQALFFKFQQSWTAGDLTPVQAYLTQSTYTRLKVQLDELNQKNEQDVLDSIVIGGMKIVKLTIDNNFVTLVTQIDAGMKDYDIDKTNKKIIDGNAYQSNRFTEYWEFIRSKTVQSNYSKGFVAQTCPNCGAPIDVNEFGQCKYCNASITSGTFDWVLDNIYQQGEFTP